MLRTIGRVLCWSSWRTWTHWGWLKRWSTCSTPWPTWPGLKMVNLSLVTCHRRYLVKSFTYLAWPRYFEVYFVWGHENDHEIDYLRKRKGKVMTKRSLMLNCLQCYLYLIFIFSQSIFLPVSADQADFWRKLVVILSKKSNSFSIEVDRHFINPIFC